ncbi:hypothetical protein ACOMHN_039924 [Nucella lapillus]
MEANVGAVDLSDELIDQFCAVTGADREIGRQLLEICHGNLEMAIGMHMDQEEAAATDQPTPSGSAGPTQAEPRRLRFNFGESDSEPGAASTACVEDDLNENGLRAPIPQRHEVLVEEAPKFGFRGRRRGGRSVFDGFRDFQAEARQHQNMVVAGRAVGKKHTLEDLFRPPIDITFKGTFHAARDRGKSENKWLLVNVQNVQEFSCQVLNRDIWSNCAVKTLVKKHFVFWQVYHDSDEGNKFMQFYSVQQWPHVAIVDPVTGENLVTWDKVDNSSFADLLKDFLEDHPTPENPDLPPAKRQKRENSIVDESEEAQMEAAIRASLSDDHQPGATTSTTSSTSTIPIPIPSSTAIASITDGDSEQSEIESDELETFTGSEEESSDAPTRRPPTSGSRDRWASSSSPSSSKPRNFSSVTGQGRAGSSSVRTRDSASSSSSSLAAGAALSSPMEDTSVPSTSTGGRDLARVIDDSENENSLGFQESYANTPNSVDILGGRSWEFHTLDSSSSSNSSSSPVSGSVVAVDNDDDTVSNDTARVQPGGSSTDAEDPTLWLKHFGDAADPTTILIVRFPDGKKEHLSLPCSSKLQALFVFCSSKGFAQDRYELVVNFPRRSLSSLDPGSTISQASLHPQETVFVQAR